jgi:hypothetical protein
VPGLTGQLSEDQRFGNDPPLPGDRFAEPPIGRKRQGDLDRGNGFGIDEKSLVAPFPPPPVRNNGSAGGGQPGHGTDETITKGAPPVHSRSPVQPPSSEASFDGSTVVESEASAAESKVYPKTKPLFQSDTRVGIPKSQEPKRLRSDSGEFQINDLPTGGPEQYGRAMSITGEYCLRWHQTPLPPGSHPR